MHVYCSNWWVRYEGAGMGRVGEGGVVDVWGRVFGGIFFK